jgi:hypothetical protein
MRCICCYCEILYDVKEPFEDDSTSHGMCEECAPAVFGNLDRELSLRAGVPSGLEAKPECCVPEATQILNSISA